MITGENMPDEIKSSGPNDEAKPPHVYFGMEKDQLMLRLFLAMTVIAVISIYIMGTDALIHILVALITVLIIHYIIYGIQKSMNLKPTYETPASPAVAGLIVGLAMPIGGPFEITAAVAALTILVFKYGQGRYLDRKYLNPAAASKTLLLVLLSAIIIFEDPLNTGMIFHPHHLRLDLLTEKGFQDSMWIFSGETLPVLGTKLTAAQSLFFWQTHGWIGGASGLAVLIIGGMTTIWLKLKWRIIVSTLITMTILATAMGIFTGGNILLRISFHVFTGSVIFMAFYMATEPQSTPMPERSQYIFGVSLAIVTFGLQLMNVLGGSIIALVLLNLATPYLDKIGYRTPYGHGGE